MPMTPTIVITIFGTLFTLGLLLVGVATLFYNIGSNQRKK
ncbi:Uncharacterised protein [Mycobacterium tuberculosis]|nr:Uncharacterised protein [Mycobacterium tuberculosis]